MSYIIMLLKLTVSPSHVTHNNDKMTMHAN